MVVPPRVLHTKNPLSDAFNVITSGGVPKNLNNFHFGATLYHLRGDTQTPMHADNATQGQYCTTQPPPSHHTLPSAPSCTAVAKAAG
eukprot:m.389282 g.389282  ORF g.389282 m.389282 type:complete len:87 (-) comp21049_c0_seq4:2-262(-)